MSPMHDLRAAWTRLGFSFAVDPATTTPVLEDALVAALDVVRDDARLFAGIAT